MRNFTNFFIATLVSLLLSVGCSSSDAEVDLDVGVDDDIVTPTTYTVTFDSTGGSDVDAQTVEEDGFAEAPETPSKDGYDFVAWYSDEDLTAVYDFAATPVTEDITLYADWKLRTYTVAFYIDYLYGDSPYYSVQCTPGETVAEPEVEDRIGYKFDGWYNGAYKWDFEVDIVPAEGVALFAVWIADTYNVVFNYLNADIDDNLEENTIYNTTVQFDWSVVAPTDPTCDQYQFAGWYTDPAPTSSSVPYAFEPIGEDDYPASGTIYLYARWIYIRTVAIINYYSAAPDYLGDEEPFYTEELILEQGAVAPTPEDIYSYTHTGSWYIQDAGFVGSAIGGLGLSGYNFSTTYPDIEDGADPTVVSLYAGWMVSQYTITFDANNSAIDATALPESVTGIEHGYSYAAVYADVEIAGCEDTNGYLFEGWYYDSDCTEGMEFNSNQIITEDVTLYAKWDREPVTVTFVYNNDYAADEEGGYEVKVYPYDPTEGYGYVELPTDLTYTDHAFMSWHTSENLSGSSVYDETLPLTENVTLYAKWWDENGTHAYISTASELAFFRDMVNSGKNYNTDITLTSSIDLSSECSATLGVNWTSISNAAGYAYTGTFEGNGYSINNLYYYASTSAAYMGGLFAYLGDGAVIQNVNFQDSYIYHGSSSGYGTVASYIATGTVKITNCTVTNGYIRGTNQAGGIFGNCYYGTVIIENCHNVNTNVVAGTNCAGGIISRLSNTSTATQVSQVINCSNSGEINGVYAGGIAGELSNNAEIIGCYNSGTISKNSTYQGGIAGISHFWTTVSSTGGHIIGCYNTGSISATTVNYVGGILGGISNVNGAVSITGCYSECDIATTGTSGGILGGNVNSATVTFASNYYTGTLKLAVGGSEVDDVNTTYMSSVSGLSSVIGTMNSSVASYLDGTGYSVVFSYVTDASSPTIEVTYEEVETEDDDEDEDTDGE